MNELLNFGVEAVARPPRCVYDKSSMPMDLNINGCEEKFIRYPFRLPNNRGNILVGSLYASQNVIDNCIDDAEKSCVIYLHGNAGCQVEGTFLLSFMLPIGISIVCFDFNGCGKSEGDYITLGYMEKDDVYSVMTYMRVHFNINSYVIWGRSMGAACSLYCLENPFQIKCVVADSPFSSLPRLSKELAPTIGVPSCLASLVSPLLRGRINEQCGFDINECYPIECVKESDVPIVIIHATNDSFISDDHSRDIFSAYKCKNKSLYLVPGKHNSNRPKQIMAQVFQFVARNLGKNIEINSITTEIEGGKLHFSGLTDMKLHLEGDHETWTVD